MNRALVGSGLVFLLIGGCSETCPPGYLRHEGQCELVLGVPCQLPGECLSGLCLKLDPQQGFCTVTCSGSRDCPGGYQCHQMLGGLCVPEQGPECQQDADCGVCSTCQDGSCRIEPSCRPCQADDECDPCQFCQGGFCQRVSGCQTCSSGLDCPPCHECSQGKCQLQAGCHTCSSSNDCPPCHQCSKGACVEISGCSDAPCFNDGDCPRATRCLPNRLLGYDTCLPIDLDYGSDCSPGGDPTCHSGLCVADDEGNWRCSQPCLQDADCPDLDFCRYASGDCRLACREPYSPPPGPDCRHALDCDSGQICAPRPDSLAGGWRNRCLPAELCGMEAGQECRSDAQCRDRRCLERGWCSPACLGNLDCPRQMACGTVVEAWAEGSKAGHTACLPAAEVPLPVGDLCPPGSSCQGDGCLALSGPGSRLCTRSCLPGGEPCPDGFSCLPDTSLGSSHACLPALAPGQCQHDLDCSDGQLCGWSKPAGRLQCFASNGTGQAPGQPCLVAGDCERGICLLEGVCSAPCTADSDCPAAMYCEPVWGSEHGLGGVFLRLCRPGEPSRERCWGESDCRDGESCRAWVAPGSGAASGRCLGENPAGAAAGESCQGMASCREGVCTAAQQCAWLCSEAVECPEGWTCQVTSFAPWPGLELPLRACLAVVGELGDDCLPDAPECQPGLFCQPLSATTGLCTRSCEQDADCQAATTMSCREDGSGGKVCMPT